MKLAIKIPVPKNSLRKKFFLFVVLPPLIPFLILSLLGYSRIDQLISASQVDQLSRSAGTTAAKLEREFAIRRTVLEKTGQDVLAIEQEYESKKSMLTSRKDSCLTAISKNIPTLSEAELLKNPEANQNVTYDSDAVINAPDGVCEPFLPEFARLAGNRETGMRAAYTNAVNTGYEKAMATLSSEEAGKQQDRLQAFLLFFPETLEIELFKQEQPLAAARQNQQTTLLAGEVKKYQASDQLPAATDLLSKDGLWYVVTGYRLEGGHSIWTALDTNHEAFLKPSWESAPKANETYSVLISDSSGNVVYPKNAGVAIPASMLKTVALKPEDETRNEVFTYQQQSEKAILRGAPIEPINWAVVTTASESQLLGVVKRGQQLALGAIAISLSVSLIVGLIFVARTTNTIDRLRRGALRFAEGRLTNRIDVKSGDELETLADTMNTMAGRILASEKALDEKNKEFISIASHELKTPMTAIIGNLSMIVDDGIGKIDRTARKLIEETRSQTEKLRQLVTEMLDIARLEAGKSDFKIETLDLNVLIEEALTISAPAARARNISLQKELSKPAAQIKGDKTKLGIVLNNFISNAIKYNREGGQVTIRLRLEGNFVVTSVADTGIGIPKAQQTHMFEKFFRAHDPSKIKVSSTGLGMYVTKLFVEKMGGKVWFESHEGTGSVFSFSIPAA